MKGGRRGKGLARVCPEFKTVPNPVVTEVARQPVRFQEANTPAAILIFTEIDPSSTYQVL